MFYFLKFSQYFGCKCQQLMYSNCKAFSKYANETLPSAIIKSKRILIPSIRDIATVCNFKFCEKYKKCRGLQVEMLLIIETF